MHMFNSRPAYCTPPSLTETATGNRVYLAWFYQSQFYPLSSELLFGFSSSALPQKRVIITEGGGGRERPEARKTAHCSQFCNSCVALVLEPIYIC